MFKFIRLVTACPKCNWLCDDDELWWRRLGQLEWKPVGCGFPFKIDREKFAAVYLRN